MLPLCMMKRWSNSKCYLREKASKLTVKVKTLPFAANDQGEPTSPSTKSLEDGEQNIWICNIFKQRAVNEKYEILKKLNFCFCCLNSHPIKDCKSEPVCGVNGCTTKHNNLPQSDGQKIDEDTKDKKNRSPCVAKQGRPLFYDVQGNNDFVQLIPNSILMTNNVLKLLRSVMPGPLFVLWIELWLIFSG